MRKDQILQHLTYHSIMPVILIWISSYNSNLDSLGSRSITCILRVFFRYVFVRTVPLLIWSQGCQRIEAQESFYSASLVILRESCSQMYRVLSTSINLSTNHKIPAITAIKFTENTLFGHCNFSLNFVFLTFIRVMEGSLKVHMADSIFHFKHLHRESCIVLKKPTACFLMIYFRNINSRVLSLCTK